VHLSLPARTRILAFLLKKSHAIRLMVKKILRTAYYYDVLVVCTRVLVGITIVQYTSDHHSTVQVLASRDPNKVTAPSLPSCFIR
jgi:hypothetical protein